MTKLAVLLTDRFADWECALLMATARSYYGFDVFTASPDGNPITSAGGLRVTPEMSAQELQESQIDALAVCGGLAWSDDDAAPDITNLLQGFAAQNTVIGAICDANLAMAKAGLLDDKAHTANAPDAFKDIPNYHGAKHYVDQPMAKRDGNIITAAGTAPISFMCEMMIALGKDANELSFYSGLYAKEHMAHQS